MNIRKIPQRKCTGCQQMIDKSSLIRIVKNSKNEFIIDESGKAQGRGAYICNSEECLLKSIKNRGLERSFKSSIDKDIYENLKKILKKGENI